MKRTSKVHDKIATDSLITFHTEKSFTDGSLLKKDSIVHWTPTGPVMKDGKPETAKIDIAVTVSRSHPVHLNVFALPHRKRYFWGIAPCRSNIFGYQCEGHWPC